LGVVDAGFPTSVPDPITTSRLLCHYNTSILAPSTGGSHDDHPTVRTGRPESTKSLTVPTCFPTALVDVHREASIPLGVLSASPAELKPSIRLHIRATGLHCLRTRATGQWLFTVVQPAQRDFSQHPGSTPNAPASWLRTDSTTFPPARTSKANKDHHLAHKQGHKFTSCLTLSSKATLKMLPFYSNTKVGPIRKLRQYASADNAASTTSPNQTERVNKA